MLVLSVGSHSEGCHFTHGKVTEYEVEFGCSPTAFGIPVQLVAMYCGEPITSAHSRGDQALIMQASRWLRGYRALTSLLV